MKLAMRARKEKDSVAAHEQITKVAGWLAGADDPGSVDRIAAAFVEGRHLYLRMDTATHWNVLRRYTGSHFLIRGKNFSANICT